MSINACCLFRPKTPGLMLKAYCTVKDLPHTEARNIPASLPRSAMGRIVNQPDAPHSKAASKCNSKNAKGSKKRT